MLLRILLFAFTSSTMFFTAMCEDSEEEEVCPINGAQLNHGLGITIPCYETYEPENCDTLSTVEDYERCAPAMMNITARSYLLGSTGRRITYNDNTKAFTRYRIIPELLRDVSESSLEVTTLGQKMSLPIGLSPIAYQKLFDPDGEIATISEIKGMAVPFTMSAYGDTTLEDLASRAEGGSIHLWISLPIFKNRTYTENVIIRAEKAGYEAVVLIVDSPLVAELTCGFSNPEDGVELVNLPGITDTKFNDPSATFEELKWVKGLTNLPIVAKGILSPSDAVDAVKAGASAILVSNYGGRREDSAPATIDVLPEIVDAVHKLNPDIDVYLDSGIRNGLDIFKAIGRGAKMVFIGRPYIYGLVKSSGQGVNEILNILQREFEEAMKLAGSSDPSEITRSTIIPLFSSCCDRFCKGDWNDENNWDHDRESDESDWGTGSNSDDESDPDDENDSNEEWDESVFEN